MAVIMDDQDHTGKIIMADNGYGIVFYSFRLQGHHPFSVYQPQKRRKTIKTHQKQWG